MNGDRKIPLYLFAKAPMPGQVKTRMQPQLSAAECAELATVMLQHTVEKVAEHWPGEKVLCVHPDPGLPLFLELADGYGFLLEKQVSGNLGDRMANVLQAGIRTRGHAAVMGCDTPQLDAGWLQYFYDQMLQNKNPVGPALDGGFYFLGLDRFEVSLFSDIQWGEDAVFSVLKSNSRALGISLHIGESERDIDTWEDLCWLASQDCRYGRFVDRHDREGEKHVSAG